MDIIFKTSNIENYSTQELKYFFKKYWLSSDDKFARQYDLNKENFANWLDGKRESNTSVLAIQKFLCDSKNNRKTFKEATIDPHNLAVRIKSLSLRGLKTLIFVRVEEYTKSIINLSYINNQNHIIIFLSRDAFSTYANFKLANPCISIIRSNTHAMKNTEILLTVMITRLDLILSNIIKFIIVPPSDSIQELKELITQRCIEQCTPKELLNARNDLFLHEEIDLSNKLSNKRKRDIIGPQSDDQIINIVDYDLANNRPNKRFNNQYLENVVGAPTAEELINSCKNKIIQYHDKQKTINLSND